MMVDCCEFITGYCNISLKDQLMKVIVRVRPLSHLQEQQIQNYDEFVKGKRRTKKISQQFISFYSKFRNADIREVIKAGQKVISVYDTEYTNSSKKMKDFTFSQVFAQNASNEGIFKKSIIQNIDGVLSGYNCTIMTYGITGSGKTYSVFGNQSSEDQGFSYLAFSYLLSQKKNLQSKQNKVYFKLSFLQIYNENIKDLLSEDCRKNIILGQDMRGNTQLIDAQSIQIKSIEQVYKLISLGLTRRISATTQSNQASSRSHAILKMDIQIVKQNQKINSKLTIIDLAGSEKINSECSLRKTEGININKSLLALGNCISSLVQNGKRLGTSHVPYRNSKLTRMLGDSLGGNSRTLIISCISLNPFTLQQTIMTLNYCQKAQGIKKNVTKNVRVSQLPQQKCSCAINKQIKMVTSIPEIQVISYEFLERLYNDIIQNARQISKLERFKLIMQKPCQQLEQFIQSNYHQKNVLKQALFSLFNHQISNKQNPKYPQTKVVKKIIRLSRQPRLRSKNKLQALLSRQNSGKNQQRALSANVNKMNISPQPQITMLEKKAQCWQIPKERRKRSKVQIIKKMTFINRKESEKQQRQKDSICGE